MGLFSFITQYGERQERRKKLIKWLVAHDNWEYVGICYHGYPEPYYYDYSLEDLVELQARMERIHQDLEYEKKHPKPKIGDTYKVYICGRHVDNLYNVTNISQNENGVFFTMTKEDGSTTMKPYFGSGNINWTKE